MTQINININKKIENKEYDNLNDLKELLSHAKNIETVLRQNNNIKDLGFYLDNYICPESLKDKSPKYTFNLYFKFKDNCTIKYCKDYIQYLIDYCKVFNLDINFDYESNIISPNVNISK